jgi:hypothetical protein
MNNSPRLTNPRDRRILSSAEMYCWPLFPATQDEKMLPRTSEPGPTMPIADIEGQVSLRGVEAPAEIDRIARRSCQ